MINYNFLLSITACCCILLLAVIPYLHNNSSGVSLQGSADKNIPTSTNSSSTIKNITASTNNSSSVSEAKNNVTTSAGNNGNIYRGGTISGSGGE